MLTNNDLTTQQAPDSPAPAQTPQPSPQPPVAQKQPKRKRSTRLALERDARIILKEFDDGLSGYEILDRHSWSRSTYYRRLALAQKLLDQQQGPSPAIDRLLKRQAHYESLLARAQSRAAELQSRLTHAQTASQPLDPRHEAALTASLLKTLAFASQCEQTVNNIASLIESEISDDLPDLDNDQQEELQYCLVREQARARRARARKKKSQIMRENATQNPPETTQPNIDTAVT